MWDVITYDDATISACEKSGARHKALDMIADCVCFQDGRIKCFMSDVITYDAATISACEESGAWQRFVNMVADCEFFQHGRIKWSMSVWIALLSVPETMADLYCSSNLIKGGTRKKCRDNQCL